MKIIKWIATCTLIGLVLWYVLFLVYFKSMSLPRDSSLHPSYIKTSSPYASFNVMGYSQDQRESVSLAMESFAHSHSMMINNGSFLQYEVFHLTFKRKDIRVKVLNVSVGDEFLHVYLYKEELWSALNNKEHRIFFDKLIKAFQDLNLQVADIKFDTTG